MKKKRKGKKLDPAMLDAVDAMDEDKTEKAGKGKKKRVSFG